MSQWNDQIIIVKQVSERKFWVADLLQTLVVRVYVENITSKRLDLCVCV